MNLITILTDTINRADPDALARDPYLMGALAAAAVLATGCALGSRRMKRAAEKQARHEALCQHCRFRAEDGCTVKANRGPFCGVLTDAAYTVTKEGKP